MEYIEHLRVLWDYLRLDEPVNKADCIIGFGNFNTDIAARAAELYFDGVSERILFTGGLGRNTEGLLPEAEARRFASVAINLGVPKDAIIIEDRSTNTRENIEFSRKLLEEHALAGGKLLGVHQPFMERRIRAAMGVYWPEANFTVTSPRVTLESYLAAAKKQGVSENASVSVIVGDFQRIDIYAKAGYQLPQYIPPEAWAAFHALVEMGFDKQLARI